MAVFTKQADFRRAVYQGEHVFSTGGDSFILTLTLTTSPSWSLGSDLPAEVDHQWLSSRALTIASTNDSAGTFNVVMNDANITSTGGNTGPFRYLWLVNNTQGGIVGSWDFTNNQTVLDGQSLIIDWTDAASRLLSHS